MVFIATVLGAFYLLSAVMVLRRARLEWLFDRAVKSLAKEPETDHGRLAFMAASAMLYGAAGLALLARSGLAVWLLGGGLAVQALYYGAAWLLTTPQAPAGDAHWTKTWTAAVLSTAAFAFAAYASRMGVLN
ncbi:MULTISPECIES: hypothetical protein [Rhodomicrobium]|uniref:hypothetical protein n=1 Tax=Rhodomicrobium TaxID=1068 RepID=UPI000B4B4B6B|nr:MULTISPECIES: hypothetical protein [Rhodomicrobium]